MRALVTVVALALVGLVAPAAHAETWSAHDARGDVQKAEVSFDGNRCRIADGGRDGSDRIHDVTRLTVDHARDQVTLLLDVRQAAPRRADLGYQLALRTPGDDYVVQLERSGRGAFRATLDRLVGDPHPIPPGACDARGYHFQVVECPRLDAEVARRIVATVPRTCLDQPAWVRAGARAFGFDEHDDPAGLTFTFWYDAWAARPGPGSLGPVPPYGPRVHAG